MPSVTSLCHPAEQDWFCTPDATIANTEALAQLVLTEAGLPPTTTLWLRTGCGWEKVSSLAALPPGDLAVKAVVGESGGHAVCIARLSVRVCRWFGNQDEAGRLNLPGLHGKAACISATAKCVYLENAFAGVAPPGVADALKPEPL